ncbi:hypothetical protein Tco_0873588, partial [Tanacetum coccineum]
NGMDVQTVIVVELFVEYGRRVRKEEVDVVDVKGLRRVVVVQRVRDMVKVVADRCIEKVGYGGWRRVHGDMEKGGG